MQAETVVDGITYGEGPVWCRDGTLVCTDVAGGVLHRIWPEQGRREEFAVTGGGPNGAVLAADGGFLVAQNGGIDFARLGHDVRVPYRPTAPGLQRVHPDGRVTYVLDEGFRAPNDLVVGADGRLWFTDPPHAHDHFLPRPQASSGEPVGRVWSWSPDQGLDLYADGFTYCNGIGFDRDGHLVVVERTGLQRVFPDGSREWLVEDLGWADGFCTDVEGNFYAASPRPGVSVIDAHGVVVDVLELPGDGEGDQLLLRRTRPPLVVRHRCPLGNRGRVDRSPHPRHRGATVPHALRRLTPRGRGNPDPDPGRDPDAPGASATGGRGAVRSRSPPHSGGGAR